MYLNCENEAIAELDADNIMVSITVWKTHSINANFSKSCSTKYDNLCFKLCK